MELKVKQPEEMVRVRCKKEAWWGPDKDTHKLYKVGEELTIPRSKLEASNWHAPETVTNEKTGRSITVRGAFEEVAKYPLQPVSDDAAFAEQQSRYQALYGENEKLREQLAALQADKAAHDKKNPAKAPGVGKGGREEI
jgi:hypothetical protein